MNVGEIFFSQDNVRDKFRDKRSIFELKAAFIAEGADPDAILEPNFIEVVFYMNKWYSMDNRRLWCLKEAFPDERLVQVKTFANEQEYNSKYGRDSWGSKYSTICSGVDIVVLPSGHKRGIESKYGSDTEERHCKVKCTEAELRAAGLMQEYKLRGMTVRDGCCTILGARRDVDMAGAVIYDRFYRNFEVTPEVRFPVWQGDYFTSFHQLIDGVERDLRRLLSELGAPEWGAEDGIAKAEAEGRSTKSRGNAKAIQDECYKNVMSKVLTNRSCLAEGPAGGGVTPEWVEKTAQRAHRTLTCAVKGLDNVDFGAGWCSGWKQISEAAKVDFMVGTALEYLWDELQDVLKLSPMTPEEHHARTAPVRLAAMLML